MSAGEIGALIPIVAMAIPIVAISTRHKRRMAELEVRRLEAEAAAGKGAANDRTEWLEDRVKVLERIVTDKGYDLAAQIEALRGQDAPRIPGRRDEA